MTFLAGNKKVFGVDSRVWIVRFKNIMDAMAIGAYC
jgi:hypothetical protein